jgi:hypothetical protein
MTIKRFVFLFLVYVYPTVNAQAADKLNGELHDPFHKPNVINPAAVAGQPSSENEAIEPIWKPKLSMTLRAGKQSSANIGGKIVKIGENIDGYKLIEVKERSVTLVKKSQLVRLNLDEAHEK